MIKKSFYQREMRNEQAMLNKKKTSYPSIDKPWQKFYTEEAIHAPLPSCTIYEYLYGNNKNYPDDIAIQYFGRRISFRTLLDEIDRVASAFDSLGIKSGDIVTMVTVTTPETVYALYALNRLGAISNMVDPRTSAEGIRDYILEAKSRIVLSIDAAYKKICGAIKGTEVERIIVTSPADSMPGLKGTAFDLIRVFSNETPRTGGAVVRWNDFIKNGERKKVTPEPYRKGRCAVIVHTGGTTGVPKGVMLSDDAINAAIVQCEQSGFVSGRTNKLLDIMPPFIAYGILIGLHFPLCRGVTVVLIPQLDPEKLDRYILQFKPNYMAGVPSHYEGLVHSKHLRNVSLEFFHFPVCGGDGMSVEYEEKVNAFLDEHQCPTHIIKGYGMTEISATVCASVKASCNKTGSVGIPLTHSEVAIFSPDTGEELPYNTPGEVCMKGPHIMLGYHKNETETRNILRAHADGSVWLHSGDLGYMDEDGCLFIQGRIKSMIIRGDGFKVFPNMVERAVESCADVESCGVIGADDYAFSQGQRPVVYIVKREDYRQSDDSLCLNVQTICEEELPEYALPMAYRVIERLPLTGIGKVDYRALKQRWEKEQDERNGNTGR